MAIDECYAKDKPTELTSVGLFVSERNMNFSPLYIRIPLSVLLGSLLIASPVKSQEKDPEVLVKNGDFELLEAGSVTGWSNTPFAVTSSTEFSTKGQRSLKITTDKQGLDPIATQVINTIKQGQTYRLQYRVRASKFNEQYRAYVGIWQKGATPQENKWLRGVDTTWRAGLDSWQQVSVNFTLNEPADFIQLVLQGQGPGTFWFDDLSLVPVENSAQTGTAATQTGINNVTLPAIKPYVGSPNFVQIMPDKTFRVKNKPFFPIKIWGWSPKLETEMAQARDWGFNIVTPTHMDSYGPKGFELWLDTAHKYEMMVTGTARFSFSNDHVGRLPFKKESIKAVIEAVKNHPALFAYNIADEPAWDGSNLAAFAEGAHLIRNLDPNHPITVNHAPRNTIADLASYNQFVDVSGSDIYPVWKTGVDKHSDLPNKTIGVVGDETTKNLQAVDNKKPVIQTLQGFAWSDNRPNMGLKDEPFPTFDQLRFMAYHTLVRGATGVAFFQDHRYTELRPELKPVTRELHALSDVLAGGKTLDGKALTNSAGIEVLVKEMNGELFIFAVNSGTTPSKANFDLTSLLTKASSSVNVINENRQFSLANKKFSDDFVPYAVHIYTTANQPQNLLRQLRPIAVKPNVAPKTASNPTKSTPKGLNLALAARATSSSVHTNFSNTAINDGNPLSPWNDNTPYTYPDWVMLDFQKPTKFDNIVVSTHKLSFFGYEASDGIRDFQLEIDDNGEWKTIHTVKGSQKFTENVVLKQPVTTSKLRLWITATNGDQDWSRLNEIEVYNSAL